MKRLFLLDAYALIYRAYYALMRSPRINSKGQNTSAIFGFVNTLEDLLNHQNPTHIAVVFDPSGPTFRHEIYKEYKANREETPEDIRFSVPIIKEIVKGYNIPVISVDGYEADDVIGTMATIAETKGFSVYMVTPDKDYGQLVTENIRIYKPASGGNGAEILGVDEVKSKWGIDSCSQVIDLLGLMGDAADNIPGCPGVGEKTAVKLLSEYGSTENLIDNSEKLKGALKKKVTENIELIKLSKYLATIKTDVPLTFDENELKREEINKDKLAETFTDLEMRSFMTRIINREPIQNEKQVQASLFDDEEESVGMEKEEVNTAFATVKTTEHDYRPLTSEEEYISLSQRLGKAETFCFDTETTSVNAMEAELVGISFALTEFEAYYIAIPAKREDAMEILEIFREQFENEKIEKTGHNLKYDITVLANYGIEVKGNLWDTMVAHYLLQPEMHHNMDFLAESLLKYKTIHIEELIGAKGKGQLSMRDADIKKVAEYAAEDADVTLRLRNKLEPMLEEGQLTSLFREIEMPLLKVLVKMERTGVIIDEFALAQASDALTYKLSEIERSIKAVAGKEINLNSPRQIGELLFDQLQLSDKPKKTKKGQYVTDEETLESLKEKHPVVKEILDHRGAKKLLSTYIDALPQLINNRTGRVHTSFNQTITATGRLSSSNPNLQNIPIRDEQGREIRKAFIASEGCQFLSADYSQVELRIMAHLSGDENLTEAFREDHDIHAATAAKIYKVPIEEVTSDMRRKAKTANFGIIYGISAFGLSERLSIPRGEAKRLIDDYFKNFPGVQLYMEQCISHARKKGYVETLLHRKRYLPDITSRNAIVRGYAERNAVNSPIQGTAADIIKIAMIKIARRLEDEGLRTEMLLQVHDELNFNVPNDELERVKLLIQEEMENAYPLNVPLKVEIGTGKNWLEAH